MILCIDTTKKESVILRVMENNKEIACVEQKASYAQAEKLLPTFKKILKKNKAKLKDIKEIIVNNDGGTFTSSRIGVVTANALAFALNVPIQGACGKVLNKKGINIVKPKYNSEPKIG